jgi:hypothetical protein
MLRSQSQGPKNEQVQSALRKIDTFVRHDSHLFLLQESLPYSHVEVQGEKFKNCGVQTEEFMQGIRFVQCLRHNSQTSPARQVDKPVAKVLSADKMKIVKASEIAELRAMGVPLVVSPASIDPAVRG